MCALRAESTTFSRDVVGRYVCNTLEEALASADADRFPGARPFDLIVLGAGTFGSVIASRLFGADRAHAHRILVLEAGPMVFTEHVQNQPTLTTGEVWGLPWNSDSPEPRDRRFPGLAYCVGGRSLFWGGWSPYPLRSELPSPPWPPAVTRDLLENVVTTAERPMSYLDLAASQLGSDTTNDFIYGSLHSALRDRLLDGLRARRQDGPTRLVGHRGTPMVQETPEEELERDLEAPLAVQAHSPKPGFFPMNKFSAVQLLIRASRLAQAEAEQATWSDRDATDTRKRLMVVPHAHVIRVDHDGRRATRVVTNQGTVEVPPDGRVFLALGTIENTRFALLTAPNPHGLIGRNLMVHLRSNLTLRLPRESFPELVDLEKNRDLQVSALFVKGLHRHDDGTLGHFHVQLTASGVGELVRDSEAELFKKVPDVDLLHNFTGMTDEWIVVTLRALGETTGDRSSSDPASRVALGGPDGDFDYGQARALVRLAAAPRDRALWDAMDRACDEIAAMLAGAGSAQYLSEPGGVWQDIPPGPEGRRDPLSSTHHEAGTLWIGTDPANSVTDEWGRFHELENLYAVGPALFPTVGSPNPVLAGVALARRTADHLVAPRPAPAEQGFVHLFDGTERTYSQWRATGRAGFALVDGTIVTQPGDDLGLLYYAPRTFEDFELKLEFRLDRPDDNSGVFVRFRDPERAVLDPVDPTVRRVYANPATIASDTGFELQIDDLARPDGHGMHRTGAFYGVAIGDAPGVQIFDPPPALGLGWHSLELRVVGQEYSALIDGKLSAHLTNRDRTRGHAPTDDPHSGFVGLQAHTGRVAFRNLRVRALAPVSRAKAEAPAAKAAERSRRARARAS